MPKLIFGLSQEEMKKLPTKYVDSIVTDPPYGLSFMGKNWDYDVPSVEIWRECLRVLKPGGHLLSFGGTRTYHRMVVNIEDAGFEIRDQIQWLYGSGFPKSHNIKEGDFKGFGTALKPANEPICLARKTLEKGLTVAENVLKYGTGALNIDGCRIGTEKAESGRSGQTGFCTPAKSTDNRQFVEGRWPANIILDEAAAQMLDEQSGVLSSGKLSPNNKVKESSGWSGGSKADRVKSTFEHNSGGASRFFYVAKASKSERNAGLEGMPLKSQGAYGEFAGDGRGRQTEHQPTANFHPTVKPIKLMQYLIKLVTPPSGIVLDPFMGSGSTGVAAKSLGFEFIGIEKDSSYYEIAERRING